MRKGIPPLNPLRAFLAAAQLGSFSKAADELCVTAAAVGQQIKLLEESIGIKLFVRRSNSLAMTEEGRAYLPGVEIAFRHLAEATAKLRAKTERTTLRLTCPPTFGLKWLMPRLHRLLASAPEMDIRLTTTTAIEDLTTSDIDLAIRYGKGHYGGLHWEHFLGDSVFPVHGAAMTAGLEPIVHPEDLANYTLLHDATRYGDASNPTWGSWLARVGCLEVDATKGLTFQPSYLAIAAATEGYGVALAKRVWVQDDLLSGKLVQPFKWEFPLDFFYSIVHRYELSDSPAVLAFKNWLIAERNVGMAGISRGVEL